MNIGARCSQIHLASGVDILLPNSVFLEKKVINWTLSDSKVRFSVKVGVAYGSPVRTVSALLMRAVREHAGILSDPEPVVIFSDFGDSALIFEVFFWLRMSGGSDSRVVCSDLRFRIEELFREAGVVMAFPQREVHLNLATPVSVRLTGNDVQSANKPAPEP